MTEQDNKGSETGQGTGQDTGPGRGRSRSRFGRPWYLAIAALALLVTGALTNEAISGGFKFSGWGHHGGGWMGGTADPARVEAMVERMVKHFAIEVDANAEQQEKLVVIAKNAAKDILPMRETLHGAREQAQEILIQATVGRTAIEASRADQIQLMDTLSKRLAQAIGDAAEILTPEQRRLAVERLQRFRGRHVHGHGG